ncbi:MAG: sigma-54-dependent Fis family transcriptional regulator [Candidatus Riflebacteria bacterium]|nr:sigma-54-dependent Fis family transcriptional regulator [Candidatus Riflebacteria bacterium]
MAGELPSPRVMVVDDDMPLGELLEEFLGAAGLETVYRPDPVKALAEALTGVFDVIILDWMMPGMDGLSFLKRLKEKAPTVEVVILTASGEPHRIVRAISMRACDYIVKPASLQKVLATVKTAITRRVANLATPLVRPPVGTIEHGFFVAGEETARLLTEVRKIARYGTCTALLGPPGSGRRHLARLLHLMSNRDADRLVLLDLARIPPREAVEQLLGHLVPTDSTGAPPIGAFKRAVGGTLVLAGIEHLPIDLQQKMLTLLESGQILEPPYMDEHFLDVKIIATSSGNLTAFVDGGLLLEELYHRLSMDQVLIRPLVDRPEEVLPMAQHFLEEASRKAGRSLSTFAPGAERLLTQYPWPGNVLELQAAVASAARAAEGAVVTAADLPQSVRGYQRHGAYQAAAELVKGLEAPSPARTGGSDSDVERTVQLCWEQHERDPAAAFDLARHAIHQVTRGSEVSLLGQFLFHAGCEHLGEWERTLAALRELQALGCLSGRGRENKELWRFVAAACLAAGLTQQASKAEREAMAAGEPDPVADQMMIHAAASLALVRQGRLEEALPLLERALSIDRGGWTAGHPAVRLLAESTGAVADALFKKLERDPTVRQALIKTATASSRYHRVCRDWIGTRRAEYRLAAIHCRLGDGKSALSHALESFLMCNENNLPPEEFFFAHEAIARAHLAAGNLDAAQKECETCALVLSLIEDEKALADCAPVLEQLRLCLGDTPSTPSGAAA